MFKSEKILIKRLFYIALYLLLVIVVMCIPRIYAYLSDGDSVTNTAIIGGTNIEVIEDFEPPAELKPKVEFKKDIRVKNNGYNACYVRVKAVFANGDMEKYCVVDWNDAIWEYNASDGYYYYRELLQSGDTTPSLFTKVTIKDDTPASLIKDFDILVYAEGIQEIAGLSGYAETWANYHTNKPTVEIPVTKEDPETQSLPEDPETEGTEGADPAESTEPGSTEPTDPAEPADPGSTDPAESEPIPAE